MTSRRRWGLRRGQVCRNAPGCWGPFRSLCPPVGLAGVERARSGDGPTPDSVIATRGGEVQRSPAGQTSPDRSLGAPAAGGKTNLSAVCSWGSWSGIAGRVDQGLLAFERGTVEHSRTKGVAVSYLVRDGALARGWPAAAGGVPRATIHPLRRCKAYNMSLPCVRDPLAFFSHWRAARARNPLSLAYVGAVGSDRRSGSSGRLLSTVKHTVASHPQRVKKVGSSTLVPRLLEIVCKRR